MTTPNHPTSPQQPGMQDATPPYSDHAITQAYPETAGQSYEQQAYSQQSYPQQAQLSQTPTAQPTTLAYTNTFALLAIVFAFISPLAGIIFGHLALGQIKRNGDAGRGIGLTGLILSYTYFAVILLFIIAYIGFIIIMFGAMGAVFSDMDFDTSDF